MWLALWLALWAGVACAQPAPRQSRPEFEPERQRQRQELREQVRDERLRAGPGAPAEAARGRPNLSPDEREALRRQLREQPPWPGGR